MAKIFSGKVYSVSEFPSVGLLKGAFYFNTTTGMCKVAVSETELKDLNISDAYVQVAGETPMTLAAWIQNIGQDFNGLEQTVGTKVAIASIHTTTAEGAATAATKVASKAYVDQEVAAAVTGGVEGLASQDWVNQQISPVSEKVTALETKTANIAVSEGATSVDGVAVKARVEAVEAAVSTKVEQSAYNTKMGEIDGALANKLESSALEGLNSDVANLKTATTGVTYVGGKTSVDGVSVVDVLNTKAVASDVETALLGKVAVSDYNAKVEELTNAINSKEGSIKVTADKALISDASGKVAASAVSATELGYLAGVKSNVQAQIDGANTAAANAEANAKSEAASNLAAAKEELQGYADQAEADAISTANGYTDDQIASLKGELEEADSEVLQSAKDYTDEEVKKISAAVEAIDQFKVETAASLEAIEKPQPKTIYLIPVEGRQSAKAEYLYIDGNWEMLGTTDVDLSLYSTTEQMTAAIATAKSGAESTAAADATAKVSAAQTTLQGNIDTLAGTVADNKTAAENAIAALEAKVVSGESVESVTVSAGTYKFVSADKLSAVIYEVIDATASTVYVEVLRGSDFITLTGTTATATAGGAFQVYQLG